MQSKAKIAVFSGIALLAVATGAYFLSPGADQNVGAVGEIAASTPVEKAPEAPKSDAAMPPPNGDTVETEPAAMAAEKQPGAKAADGASLPSGKLTKEQLTPPKPKTEDERLQQAAEREYNRF
jgi:hypothetical protein